MEFPVGLDATQSFSKIKLPALKAGTTQNKNQLNSSILRTYIRVMRAAVAKINWRSRFVPHISLMLAAVIIVFGGSFGRSGSEVTSLLANQSGFGSVLDPLAAADVAATVADKTDLLVASEATQTATTLGAHVSLPLSGDDYLAKRQVVATAGNANRGISQHKVAAGETLATVASKYNITTDTIKWANNLQSDSVTPGQKLVILPITGVLHKVVAGETPELLARRYQANAAQIISFNNAEVKGLQPGQQIVIPDGTAPQTVQVATSRTRQASAGASAPVSRTFRSNGYAYGYCTYYVAGRRPIPNGWGDARSWYYNAQYSGFKVGRTPAVGAIAWTPRGYYGHVALVEQVDGDRVFVTEMNYNGNWNRVTSRWVNYTEFSGYIY